MKKTLLFFLFISLFLTDVNAQALLFNQTDSMGTSGILARKHDLAANFGYDTEGADDFTVPTGETWYVDSLKIYGFYSTTSPIPTVTPAIVTIYDNNAGLPGTAIFADTLAEVDVDKDGNLEPSWATPIVLTAGTYWLSVRAYSSSAAWYWRRITPQFSPYVFQWKNPGGAYTVCTTWEPLSTCLAINDSSVAFQFYGCYGPNKPSITDLGADTTICGAGSIQLSTGSSQNNLAYIWNVGGTSNSITVDSAGYYRVIVYDTSTLCGTSSDINVTYAADPDPGLSDKQGCEGTGTSFSVTSCNTCQYVWEDGSTGFFHQVTAPTTVQVTMTDTVTGCSGTDTASFSYFPFSLTIVPGDSLYLCSGESIVLKTEENFVSKVWNVNGVPSNDDSITVTSTGSVLLLVTDSNNCDRTDTIDIYEGLPANPTISQGYNSGEIVLEVNETFESYIWSTGDTTAQISVSQSGTYFVTVTNEYGCEGVMVKSVSPNAFGISEAELSQINIYPNPTSEQLTIKWPTEWVGNASGSIIDQTGRIVQKFNADQHSQQINVQSLANGVYMINLRHEDGMVQYQVVKQ